MGRPTTPAPPMSPENATPDWLNALGHAAADKRLEVLRQVGLSGSISQAARRVGISYKAAWQAIDTLSNTSGAALVERTVGGAGGGGAKLTPQGQRLLSLSSALAEARQRVLLAHANADAPSPPLTGYALGLRTSMRNQLPVSVVGLRHPVPGETTVEVALEAPGGARLLSLVTAESADLLGLVPGLPVIAMCKATAVVVCPGPGSWAGLVDRVSTGGGRTEVVLALPGGGHWVGFAEPGGGIAQGVLAHANMPASAVVIGLGG